MLAGFPPVGGPLQAARARGPLGALRFARLLPESAVGLGGALFDGGGRAGVAVRRGDARRHAAGRRGQRDRRRAT